MTAPFDFMAKAKPLLVAFAKANKTPVVLQSPVSLPPQTVAAAKQTLNGICPGQCTPSCWEMARTVMVLLPDGTEALAAMFFQCQCVDGVGDPCVQVAPAPAAAQ